MSFGGLVVKGLQMGIVGKSGIAPGSTPSFVNISAASSTNTTTLPLALPVSIVAGNILIGVTSIASTRAPSWPAGWTPVGSAFAGYRIADGTESGTVNVTQNTAVAQSGWILQFSAGIVGATGDNQAQTGTTASVTAITTTRANSRCEGIVLSGTSTIPSLPSGFTNDTTVSLVSPATTLRACGVNVAAAGGSSGNLNSTVASGVWRALLIELKTL